MISRTCDDCIYLLDDNDELCRDYCHCPRGTAKNFSGQIIGFAH